VGITLTEGEGGGDAGDTIADDDEVHSEGFAFLERAVTIYYCGSSRYRMGGGGELLRVGPDESWPGVEGEST
jgi:hypothetical protein